MEGPAAQQLHQVPDPRLLLDLPGPVFELLWMKVRPQDRLRLFQLCRGVRDQVLNSCYRLGFTVVSQASLGADSRALLRTVLLRPLPLSKMNLRTGGRVRLGPEAGALLCEIMQHASAEAPSSTAHAKQLQRPAAASGLREIRLERVAITAGTAASLPSAFPHLAALQLAHCELHTAALLTALRGCQHLSSVVLEEPVHSGSTGLLAAAAPHWQAAVQRSISSREETSTPIARPGGRLTKSVATGLLLSRLPSLSCVTLSMGKSHRVLQGLAACVGGAAGRLQRLAISDTTVVRAETMDHYFLPALRACTSLKGLELGFEVPRSRFPDLARCPGLRGLRSLHIRKQVLDLRELDALLGGLPELLHLAVRSFEGLKQSRADSPCSWRRLELSRGDLEVETLAHLPLRGLTEGVHLTSGAFKIYSSAPPALLEAAHMNLACCPLPLLGPEGQVEGELRAPSRSPALLRLLPFFSEVQSLRLGMKELGAEEVAALGQAGQAVAGLRLLELRAFHGQATQVRPDFWGPALWAALPGLAALDVKGAGVTCSPAAVDAMVQCFAAAPRPVTVRGLQLGDVVQQAALQVQLAELPGCQVKLE